FLARVLAGIRVCSRLPAGAGHVGLVRTVVCWPGLVAAMLATATAVVIAGRVGHSRHAGQDQRASGHNAAVAQPVRDEPAFYRVKIEIKTIVWNENLVSRLSFSHCVSSNCLVS